jgi:hypothetical protein
MKKILTLFLCFSLPLMAFSQEIVGQEAPQSTSGLVAATELPIEGTYQIIIRGSNTEMTVDEAILLQVNHQRALDEDRTLYVSAQVSILIYSIQKIRDKDFGPGPKYVYKD